MEIRTNKAGRKVLANLFKDKIAVEVGTESGRYAEVLAQVAKKLYVVDLWKNYDGYREHVSDSAYENILAQAHKRLDKYGVGFIRDDSVVAAELFEDEYLGAIYLDANHTEEAVYKDLVAWYPKLTKGGILAGHDYMKTKDFGVIEALHRFCAEKGIGEITVWYGDRTNSFHVVKPA